jgi:trans-2,3-dihydro-3-hydroxyanthranilate isomerase
MEVPFAGHPTIGTAVALADAGHGTDMVLELGVGPLRAHAARGAAQFETAVPLEIEGYPDPALVARAMGLDPAQIATARHAPAIASVGLPFTLTELRDRATLAACRPDTAAFEEGRAAHPGALDFAQFAYVREGATVHARMFAPLDGVPEDPATGSAAAALAAFLASREGPLSLTVRQGEDMGRPARIDLQADGGHVTVAGRARRVMEGRLLL